MHDFFFWSGVVAWGIVGLIGLFYVMDAAIDWLVSHLWTKKEFLAFVADRLRKRNAGDRVPGG